MHFIWGFCYEQYYVVFCFGGVFWVKGILAFIKKLGALT